MGTMGSGWSTTLRLATWRQRAESSSTTLRMTTVLSPLTTTGTSGRTETGFTTLASTCKPADHHHHHHLHHHHFQQISFEVYVGTNVHPHIILIAPIKGCH